MNKHITVSELNRYLKTKFETDPHLQQVLLEGEISNFKAHSSGHLYFNLKDANSRISAVMFASYAKTVNFKIENGSKVIVKCSVSVYEVNGNYQIYVSQMQLSGLGNLFVLFEQLKKKLYLEGLFESHHKKAFPKYPKTIGIITAQTGAAIHDMVSTIERRYPIAKIIVFPCLVQGEQAKYDIVQKIQLANTYPLDLVILGRGGGSIEDLWAFNEEIVARAIYDSTIPIVVGIGHETDVTIADYVADLRGATPTAAAELVTPDIREMMLTLDQFNDRLNRYFMNVSKIEQLRLDRIKSNPIFINPLNLTKDKRHQLEYLKTRLFQNANQFIFNKRLSLNQIEKKVEYTFSNRLKFNDAKLQTMIASLIALNPLKTLQRGYSVVYHHEDIITSIHQIKIDDTIKVSMSDGNVFACITSKEES